MPYRRRRSTQDRGDGRRQTQEDRGFGDGVRHDEGRAAGSE